MPTKLSRVVLAGFLVAGILALYLLFSRPARKLEAFPAVGEIQPSEVTATPREKTPLPRQSRPIRSTVKLAKQLSTPAEWKYRGNATLDAAFESVLWAKAQNNLQILSNLISMSPDLLAQADRALSNLDAVSRNRYGINSRSN
ncbi:MAG: hypothetical protein ABIZ04_12520 [Opitutus sp.]